ncbi:DUF885 domain-containing protein [Ideonella sp. 4Y16]|nr:DUF885 domain-containing protein [Ideonella alba]
MLGFTMSHPHRYRRFSAQAPLAAIALVAGLVLAPVPSLAAHHRPAPMPTSAQRDFAALSHAFIEALWRIDPDAAIYAGRYEGSGRLPVPDAAARAARLAFVTDWQQRLAAVDAQTLGIQQRTDLIQLRNKLEQDRFELEVLRQYRWDPSAYSIAGPIDLMLQTRFAPEPQRLRLLLRRLQAVPAYYQAAQQAIEQPTREHTALAIAQAPGNLSVLDELGRAARASKALGAAERRQFEVRLGAAKAAVDGYVEFLRGQLRRMDAEPGYARPFRLGGTLYEQKFRLDIQSERSAAQTYDAALQAREQLLTQMADLARGLWPRVIGPAAPPTDRLVLIGQVIDKLSERHVARADFYPEIRRQIATLQDWVRQKDLISQDPRKPLVVRETPVYQRGVAGAGIESPGPYRPQDRTYYNVTPLDELTDEQAESTLREYNHWILQILNIHEAVPGHYTQLVHANRSPSLVKTLFGNGAMIEGWAVFSERMMLENGWGDHAPEMWLMWCKWNLRSVTNAILDYAVHVQGMTETEALDLLTRQAFQTPQEAREKWRRVTLTSVQLTSYFSGYSEIMALRQARQAQLGERFRVKDFNEQFLSYGNAPVGAIRALMLERAATPQ